MVSIIHNRSERLQPEDSLGLDIFGDVHGHADALEAAFGILGYQQLSGIWRHPMGRKALFVGDLIDRGPRNRDVIRAVRGMTDAGEAICLMGNHELNAVHFATQHPANPGSFLRPRVNKNIFQHLAFLGEYRGPPAESDALAADIAWMRTLPLLFETDRIRAVHACWNDDAIARLNPDHIAGHARDADFWIRTATRDDEWMESVEVLLKGPEMELPDGRSFHDKEGHQRREARIRWWSDGDDPADRVIGPPALTELVRELVDLDTSAYAYGKDEKPVFFGHYWLTSEGGIPVVSRPPNAQCLDFSVGSGTGHLGVYSWDGEDVLDPRKLTAVSADGRTIGRGESSA